MGKRSLNELIDAQEPAIDFLRQLASDAEVPCELLPPGPERENALLYLQVTTHSTLGALAYDTGGILVDNGWVLRTCTPFHEDATRVDRDYLTLSKDQYY